MKKPERDALLVDLTAQYAKLEGVPVSDVTVVGEKQHIPKPTDPPAISARRRLLAQAPRAPTSAATLEIEFQIKKTQKTFLSTLEKEIKGLGMEYINAIFPDLPSEAYFPGQDVMARGWHGLQWQPAERVIFDWTYSLSIKVGNQEANELYTVPDQLAVAGPFTECDSLSNSDTRSFSSFSDMQDSTVTSMSDGQEHTQADNFGIGGSIGGSLQITEDVSVGLKLTMAYESANCWSTGGDRSQSTEAVNQQVAEAEGFTTTIRTTTKSKAYDAAYVLNDDRQMPFHQEFSLAWIKLMDDFFGLQQTTGRAAWTESGDVNTDANLATLLAVCQTEFSTQQTLRAQIVDLHARIERLTPAVENRLLERMNTQAYGEVFGLPSNARPEVILKKWHTDLAAAKTALAASMAKVAAQNTASRKTPSTEQNLFYGRVSAFLRDWGTHAITSSAMGGELIQDSFWTQNAQSSMTTAEMNTAAQTSATESHDWSYNIDAKLEGFVKTKNVDFAADIWVKGGSATTNAASTLTAREQAISSIKNFAMASEHQTDASITIGGVPNENFQEWCGSVVKRPAVIAPQLIVLPNLIEFKTKEGEKQLLYNVKKASASVRKAFSTLYLKQSAFSLTAKTILTITFTPNTMLARDASLTVNLRGHTHDFTGTITAKGVTAALSFVGACSAVTASVGCTFTLPAQTGSVGALQWDQPIYNYEEATLTFTSKANSPLKYFTATLGNNGVVDQATLETPQQYVSFENFFARGFNRLFYCNGAGDPLLVNRAATSTAPAGKFVLCACEANRAGPNCEINTQSPSPCECMNGGTCYVSGHCGCTPGFAGSKCDRRKTSVYAVVAEQLNQNLKALPALPEWMGAGFFAVTDISSVTESNIYSAGPQFGGVSATKAAHQKAVTNINKGYQQTGYTVRPTWFINFGAKGMNSAQDSFQSASTHYNWASTTFTNDMYEPCKSKFRPGTSMHITEIRWQTLATGSTQQDKRTMVTFTDSNVVFVEVIYQVYLSINGERQNDIICRSTPRSVDVEVQQGGKNKAETDLGTTINANSVWRMGTTDEGLSKVHSLKFDTDEYITQVDVFRNSKQLDFIHGRRTESTCPPFDLNTKQTWKTWDQNWASEKKKCLNRNGCGRKIVKVCNLPKFRVKTNKRVGGVEIGGEIPGVKSFLPVHQKTFCHYNGQAQKHVKIFYHVQSVDECMRHCFDEPTCGFINMARSDAKANAKECWVGLHGCSSGQWVHGNFDSYYRKTYSGYDTLDTGTYVTINSTKAVENKAITNMYYCGRECDKSDDCIAWKFTEGSQGFAGGKCEMINTDLNKKDAKVDLVPTATSHCYIKALRPHSIVPPDSMKIVGFFGESIFQPLIRIASKASEYVIGSSHTTRSTDGWAYTGFFNQAVGPFITELGAYYAV